MKALGNTPPKDLGDWQIARVLNRLKGVFNACNLPAELKTASEAYWTAFYAANSRGPQ